LNNYFGDSANAQFFLPNCNLATQEINFCNFAAFGFFSACALFNSLLREQRTNLDAELELDKLMKNGSVHLLRNAKT
jgi:hypothetical protein